MLIVELNEFNRGFLEKGANTLNLKNLSYVLKLDSSTTESIEKREHHGLDPWVQWVSIHTGKKLENHGIIRNSDVEKLEFKQFWEILGEKGISTGIWGAMNAKKNDSKMCYFFLPDPWNYSELPYPKSLSDFIFLPRYYSKNYTKISKIKILLGIAKLLNFLLNPFLINRLLRDLPNIIKYLIFDGLNNNNLFGIFDLISTEIFIYYKNKFRPDVGLVFLNSIAHFQHHYWDSNKLNIKGRICLEIIDNIIGKLLKNLDKNEPLLILNGLSQKNVKNKGYFIYKQISSKTFLNDFKIKFSEIEQCMTNDGHIKFKCIDDLNKAKYILEHIFIQDKRLFFTENISSKNNFILFWQIDFYGKVKENSEFHLFDKKYDFFKYFVLLAERTGSHIPNGEILYRNFFLPKKLKNYELNGYLINYFDKKN